MTTGKSLIIIGAGIGGLAAGCYAQMNGYRTQIFEMHALPVETPLTTERFTGSFVAYQAWPVPGQKLLDALSGKGLSKTLPGLSHFYMVGQWVGGLGLPNVAAMGRRAIADLCKRDGRRFVTTRE